MNSWVFDGPEVGYGYEILFYFIEVGMNSVPMNKLLPEQSEAVIMSAHSSNVPLLIMPCSSKYFKYEHLIQQIYLLSQYFKQAISRTFAEISSRLNSDLRHWRY